MHKAFNLTSSGQEGRYLPNFEVYFVLPPYFDIKHHLVLKTSCKTGSLISIVLN